MTEKTRVLIGMGRKPTVSFCVQNAKADLRRGKGIMSPTGPTRMLGARPLSKCRYDASTGRATA